MPKANRTCYCCGREYYFCPSCPSDRKDPLIYTMWDSDICKDIFNTLTKESTKKITTKECKDKLIELGVDKVEINKESVKKHVDRIMNYKDVKDVVLETEKTDDVEVETNETVEISELTETTDVEEVVKPVEIEEASETVETITETPKMNIKKRKNYYKNNN